MSVLKTLKETQSLNGLAHLLGYQPKMLSYLLYKIPAAEKYTNFTIPKKNGQLREINAPVESIKLLQRRLANVLYECRHEIETAQNRKVVLSHAFRRKIVFDNTVTVFSIVSNAQPHRKRRYVLNIDIEDFFPSFNFGRVRGFFIKDKSFMLNEKVATVIAQIACHENALPQGSPCSPVVADLIANVLDMHLVKLAKVNKATYSRYADDITFSTSKKNFSSGLVVCTSGDNSNLMLSDKLINRIKSAGFSINDQKTRIQHRNNRQIVTGLSVNEKVNVRSDYYRSVRSMCHSLFCNGFYYIKGPIKSRKENLNNEKINGIEKLQGMLSHINYVKEQSNESVSTKNNRNRDLFDLNYSRKEGKVPLTSFQKLYKKFTFYRYFVKLEAPLIICEGKTDNIYLKFAIKKLSTQYPQLGYYDNDRFVSKVKFFNYNNKAHNILGICGGSDNFRWLVNHYSELLMHFDHKPLAHPVILLIDNDDGAREIFSSLNKKGGRSINFTSKNDFFLIFSNLYLIKTPEIGSDGISSIESFFDDQIKSVKINGKTFNPGKKIDINTEYGKSVFAEKVVRPNVEFIDFSGFSPLLQRLVSVINDYEAKE